MRNDSCVATWMEMFIHLFVTVEPTKEVVAIFCWGWEFSNLLVATNSPCCFGFAVCRIDSYGIWISLEDCVYFNILCFSSINYEVV